MADTQIKRTMRNDLAFEIPALATFVRQTLNARAMSEIWELASREIGGSYELVDMTAFPVRGGGQDVEFTIRRKEALEFA